MKSTYAILALIFGAFSPATVYAQSSLADCEVLIGTVIDSSSSEPEIAAHNRLAVSCIGTLVEEIRRRPVIPTGAVIALDNPNGCPSGWEDMGSTWAGRSLVAAVSDANNEFGFGKTGGVPEYVIDENQMPRHRHNLTATLGGDSPGSSTLYLTAGGPTPTASQFIGGATPVNNMPPYVALYFCKKQ